MESLRIVVAINPSASFGRGARVGPLVVRRIADAGHDVVPLVTGSHVELVEAVTGALPGAHALVVVGGDGLVNLAVNLLAGTDVPLGIVPSGTGNDMARSLGIPLDDPDAAIDAFLSALARPPRAIDVGVIVRDDGTVTRFACTVSAGFDAVVNERANRLRWPKGPNRYNLAIAWELVRLRPIAYDLTLDGAASATVAMMVSVGNGVSLGGGMRVTPNASLDDGMLDVLVVDRLTRLQFLRIFPRVFRGTHLADPRVHVHRVRQVRVAASGVVAYADGERIGPLPIEIGVEAGALLVLAPPAPTA